MTDVMEDVRTSSSCSFDEAWGAVADVEGWLTRGQAQALFDGARNAPDGAIIEIGSHHGRSTIILARGAGSGTRIHAIDPFDNARWGGGEQSLRIFRDNIERAGVAHMIHPFRGISAEAVESWSGGPIALLYIDGAHDLASVLIDIDGWEPHVVSGGLVFIHDAFSSMGVTWPIAVSAMSRPSAAWRFSAARRCPCHRPCGTACASAHDCRISAAILP
jgi:predicted O-methyltransferase YrrM